VSITVLIPTIEGREDELDRAMCSAEGQTLKADAIHVDYDWDRVGAAATRNLMLQYIAQVSKTTGEMPSLGIMGFGTWTLLAQDFTTNERYNTTPGMGYGAEKKVEALFRALDVGGVPFYADPYCPEGTLYLININYLSLFLHERAAFSFTGFESTLPNNQLGYVGAILSLLELVDVKCKAHGKFVGLNFLNI